MSWLFALALGAAAASGAYLATSRDVLRCVVGLSLLASAITLLVLGVGRFASTAPPIVLPGDEQLGASAAALPQALALTAIVIGFALLAFALVLVLAVSERFGGEDALALRHFEATPQGDEPPLEPLDMQEGEHPCSP